MPRILRAPDLERTAWDEVTAVLTNEEYLLGLATDYMADFPDRGQHEDKRNRLVNQITSLKGQKTRIVRTLAESNELSTLNDAVAEVNSELIMLEQELHDTERQLEGALIIGNIEQQINNLADGARECLTKPTTELMAEIFDLLQVDLARVSSERFEGTGSVPLLEDGGDVWEEEPRR